MLAQALDQLNEPSKIRQAKITAYGAALLVYFPLAAVYAAQYYPIIPYAFGGGKPGAITIWLIKRDLPVSFEGEFACSTDGEDLDRCDKAYLLHDYSDGTIIVDTDKAHGGPAFVLPKHSVKGVQSRKPAQ